MIPRLPPADQSIDVTITVGKNLRPYFTFWYQRMKKDGESPQHFALRILKESALDDYIQLQASALINQTNNDVQTDIPIFTDEVQD